MKLKIEIPFYHGTGDTATESMAPITIKIKKKEMLKAIKRNVNGTIIKGQIIAGDGSPIIPRFEEIAEVEVVK